MNPHRDSSPVAERRDGPARQPRLLVVNDQPVDLRTLHRAFAADHEILTADHGGQALALCAGPQPPDLVLLDVATPGLDGHEVLRRLKADAATRDIPVILVTGHEDEAAAASGLATGAADFVSRPISPALVRARVSVHLLLKAKSELLLRGEGEQRRLAATLNAVLDALPAHIGLLDERGVITSVNAAWKGFARANGMRSPDCGVGQDYAQLCDAVEGDCADDAAHTARGIRAVLAGQSQQVVLDYPCHSPGEERWFRMSVMPLNPAATGDAPGGAVVMHVEKSERKRAELASLLELTDALILVFDANGRVETANPAFGRATGWSALEAATLTAAMWPQPMPTRATRQMRVQQVRRDGSSFTAEWSVSPVCDRDGRLLSHVCIGRDVTREQQVQEGLRENDKLRATAVLAGSFAHDFNNLLGSILGLVELCVRDAPHASRLARNLGRIGQAGGRAAALVRQLLDFSRQTPKTMQRMRASELLAHADGLLRAALPAGVGLDVTIVDDAPINIDLVQMEQVLLNLSGNAAHAMRHRGGLIRVVVDQAELAAAPPSAAAAQYVRLRVIDHGEGIAPDVLKRIFEPFFTTKPVGEGTGLGLAAVHGIVSSHDGAIEVASEPGVGTTFSVFLQRSPGPSSAPAGRF